MAPDLSNLSRSPRSSSAVNTTSSPSHRSPNRSRRASSVMGPPPIPHNSSLPNSPRPPTANIEGQVMGTPGPIRHPRPLTAAELHLELEKEQESIVNRLTRELSALRAQTASVASTASSTSDLFSASQSDSFTHPYQSGIIPTSARRHRSSSNLSSRSARSTRDALTNAASSTSVSGVAAPRDTSHHSHQNSNRPSIDIPRPDMSRQNSSSGAYRTPSNANTAPASATSPHWSQHHQSSRHSISSNYGNAYSYPSHASDSVRSPSGGTQVAAARYEEAAIQRAELEVVKKENDALRQKVKDLERTLAAQTQALIQNDTLG